MMIRVRVGDLGEIVTGTTPQTKVDEFWGAGYPFVTPSELVDGARRPAFGRTVTRLARGHYAKRFVPPNSVAVCCIGSVGKAALLPEESLTNQQINTIIVDQAKHDPRFVYYLMTQNAPYLRAIASGSATPIINKSAFAEVPVDLPPIPEQRAIAEVLGALDDKIELNERMNATLDEMARALFKSWFVDFDPVRAKAEGRQPSHMDAATAALFPASFEDSPLGPIPAGWRVSTVGDEFEVTMGQSPPGESYNQDGDGLPFFQGRRDFGFRFPNERVYCTDPRRFAEAGDTLISVRAPVGDLNVAPVRCCIGRGIAAVRHSSGSAAYTFHNMAAIREQMVEYEAGGTVFGSINKKDMAALTVIAPPEPLTEAFERVAGPLEALIASNWRESRTLAELRDTLLPKLISGEVRVEAPACTIGRAC